MRSYLTVIVLMISGSAWLQTIHLTGKAPSYVGNTIELYSIQDYFSNTERLITTTKVLDDSSFTIRFESPKTQKIIVKSKNNKGHLFVQPNGNYSIFFPEKDKFDPYRPNGNSVEVAFYNLDSSDINYKILSFQRWIDNFIGNYYHLKSRDATAFAEGLDRFKSNVEKAYKEDSSTYFKTHVRFSIAGLDNVQHAAERNRYEKHDFYIKHTPVQYHNEAYMTYISDFYQKLMPRLSNEANQAVYEGVLQSSPTVIMRALGSEYTLINMRIREMIMIRTLGEMFHSKDFPQTNVITILDSLTQNCLFEANEIIAANIRSRITALVPGGKAPDIVLIEDKKEVKTLLSFSGKHIYFHFFDPESEQNNQVFPLLNELHETYKDHIQFVSIYKKSKRTLSVESKKLIDSIQWDNYGIESSNSIWKAFNIDAYPQYSLIDAAGYIVASPSLGPTPNGQYETIDKTFFYIKKAWEDENNIEEKIDRN